MANKDANPKLSKKVRRALKDKRKKEWGMDPLTSKIKSFGENARFRRQEKAAKELGMDTEEKLDRPYSEPYKFTNNQRVNRRAMQQAESKKLQRAARKKQKASDTNKRYAQLVGDMINPVQQGKNIVTSAQMATKKAKEVLRRMQKDKK